MKASASFKSFLHVSNNTKVMERKSFFPISILHVEMDRLTAKQNEAHEEDKLSSNFQVLKEITDDYPWLGCLPFLKDCQVPVNLIHLE